MDDNGIIVKVNDLTRLAIGNLTKRQIATKLMETYSQSEEYQKLLNSIEIDQDELKDRVMDKLVEEIIENWRRDER